MIEEQSFTGVEQIIRKIGLDHDGDYFYFYRGHSDKEYELVPSVYRKQEWISNEEKLVREIILRCPEDFTHYRTAFEKLVKMQHYDLPTRLLDVTENPLAALYFSCMTNPKKDGELLIFKVKKSEIKYFDSDTVSILSNIAWMDVNFKVGNSNTVKQFNRESNENAVKLLHNIKGEKPHFMNKINPDDIQSVLCVRPMMDNQRLIRQDGAFFIFGIDEDKSKHAPIPSDWGFLPDGKRVIIKARNKKRVLKLLSMMGVTKAKLFPEVDQVASFVKEGLGWNKLEPKVENHKPAKGIRISR